MLRRWRRWRGGGRGDGGLGLASRSVCKTLGGGRGSHLCCRDLTEISRRVLECGGARMPLQRLNRQIGAAQAGKMKDGDESCLGEF